MIDQQKIKEKAIFLTSMITRYNVVHIKTVIECKSKDNIIFPMVEEIEKILTEGIKSFNKDQDEQT